MKEEFQRYFDMYLGLFPDANAEGIEFLRSALTIQEYAKKDLLFKSGDIQREVGFVCKGLLRRYYVNDRGNKITTGFVKENNYASDYPAFIRQIPSKYFIECLEPSVIIKLSYDKIQEAYKRYKKAGTYGRLVAEYVLTHQTDRVESFLFNTAEERYLKFIKENSDIMNRISLSQLASYLGIERQSLSRIRSRLSKK
ncbi:Crp/Fnr family transcriptional regulator [Flavobacteriaceae bacterium TP-CH-4]|uniref:Crp/Fnr family transcriptional regulator n=1 Tax=Pelagihabitans pacificus TaxID=2696054 RepID=A0A967AVU3_9FLAO|nr:Crp/Fnr family transcriptional regulator [Pelagihabitans pacificus]NHF60877.1 Crp/Fnr family transcriptional regulator [Pelagihabitans pacificus]